MHRAIHYICLFLNVNSSKIYIYYHTYYCNLGLKPIKINDFKKLKICEYYCLFYKHVLD